jgi:hypothetical protein
MNSRRHWFWVAPLALLVVSPAAAQTVEGLSPRTVLIGLGSAAAQATGSPSSNVGEVIADLVALQVSTAPIGSSAGGFTFTFDTSTRTFRRAASSLGPSFSERAITAGAGRASIGFNYLHSTYTSLDGHKLDDGSLQTIVFRNAAGTPLYTGRMTLDMKSDTLVVFANVAMNDWFDVGIAVPYVRLSLSGSSDILQSTGAVLAPVSGAASSSGFGDVALRAKARVFKQEGGGFAIGVDARVPTGDKEALIGSGVTRTLVSGIWSATRGRFLPHASGGFEYWANPFEVFDPITNKVAETGRHAMVYDGGVEFAASDRLTVNGELLGRMLQDGAALDFAVIQQIPNPQGITTAAVARATATTRNQVTAAFGLKFNFAGSALVSASVLLPMQDIGLRSRITPVIGIDWGF